MFKQPIIILLLLSTAGAAGLYADDQAFFNSILDQIRQRKLATAYSNLDRMEKRYPASPFIPELELRLAGYDMDYLNTLVRLKIFIKNYPDHPLKQEAIFQLAEIYYLHNNFTEALAGFTQLTNTRPPGRRTADSLFWIGNILIYRQDLEASASVFRRMLTLPVFPGHSSAVPQAYLRLGDIRLQTRKYDSAITNFKAVLRTDKKGDYYAEAIFGLAESYFLSRDRIKASLYYTTVASNYPGSELARLSQDKLRYLVHSAPLPFMVKHQRKPKSPDLKPETGPKTENNQSGKWSIQAGSFTNLRAGNDLRISLRKAGYPAEFIKEKTRSTWIYKIRVGQYSDENDAGRVKDEINKRFSLEAFVVSQDK
jgi:TolA-binding protein